MIKSTKYLIVCFIFFFMLTMSCNDKSKNSVVQKSECEQIKDVITNCLGLHEGALGYVDSCGDISLSEVESLNSCDEIFEYMENKD